MYYRREVAVKISRIIEGWSQEKGKERALMERRAFLKFAAPLGVLLASPAFALDLFKVLDPEGKNEDLQKAKGILEGAKSIVASSVDLNYESEFAIGEGLALEGFKRYGMSVKDDELQKYVNLTGNAVARNSNRPNIPYYFVVVDSPLYNAFSCPGGIIFVSSALIGNMADESELACVLAHEVAHVGHKHALKTLKRAKFLEGVGQISKETMKKDDGKKFNSLIGNLQTVLFDKGLDKTMEYEADLSGMETAYRTGYDPEGLIRVLNMLKTKESGAHKKGSWFSTHPPLDSRIGKCREKLYDYPDSSGMARVKDRFLRYRAKL